MRATTVAAIVLATTENGLVFASWKPFGERPRRADRRGSGRYRVTGGKSGHSVDLFTPNHPRCDGGDQYLEGSVRKHILGAQLHEGKTEVVSEVGTLGRG